jgi:hypothetical protein
VVIPHASIIIAMTAPQTRAAPTNALPDKSLTSANIRIEVVDTADATAA